MCGNFEGVKIYSILTGSTLLTLHVCIFDTDSQSAPGIFQMLVYYSVFVLLIYCASPVVDI